MCGNLCCGNIGLWSDLVCCPSQHCETFISLNDILHTAIQPVHTDASTSTWVCVSHICCTVKTAASQHVSVWGSWPGLIMITNMALFSFEWYWCIFNLSQPTRRIDIIFTSAWVEHSVEIPAFCSNYNYNLTILFISWSFWTSLVSSHKYLEYKRHWYLQLFQSMSCLDLTVLTLAGLGQVLIISCF